MDIWKKAATTQPVPCHRRPHCYVTTSTNCCTWTQMVLREIWWELLQYEQQNCKYVEPAFVWAVLNLCLRAGACKATESYSVTRILCGNCRLSLRCSCVRWDEWATVIRQAGRLEVIAHNCQIKYWPLYFYVKRFGCVRKVTAKSDP